MLYNTFVKMKRYRENNVKVIMEIKKIRMDYYNKDILLPKYSMFTDPYI